MLNVVREYLEKCFEKDKDDVIGGYLTVRPMAAYVEATYKEGAKVIVNLVTRKAYTRNSFFYQVILKDIDYLEKLFEEKQDTIALDLLSLIIGDKFDFLKEKEEAEDKE